MKFLQGKELSINKLTTQDTEIKDNIKKGRE